MSRLKKRRIAHRKEAELEVTPFMNMMMLLVCALLASVVFTKITVIDLDFPAGNGSGAVDPDLVHLEVIVRDDQLVVADGRGGAIKTLPTVNGAQDLKGLSLVMREAEAADAGEARHRDPAGVRHELSDARVRDGSGALVFHRCGDGSGRSGIVPGHFARRPAGESNLTNKEKE